MRLHGMLPQRGSLCRRLGTESSAQGRDRTDGGIERPELPADRLIDSAEVSTPMLTVRGPPIRSVRRSPITAELE